MRRIECVTGGSSGGYGALHLGSKYPDVFGLVAAIAPDSFFEASLFPEMYQALPLWEKYKESGLKALEDLRNGKLTKHRNWHVLLNSFGMAACYCPKEDKGDFRLPFNANTGEKIPTLWNEFLSHDPLYFCLSEFLNCKNWPGYFWMLERKIIFICNLALGKSNVFRVSSNRLRL